MRTHLTATLLAVAAAALLAAPAGANDTRDFRVGLNDSFDLIAADIAGMGKANAQVFRANFSWVKIESGEPRDGSRCNVSRARMPGVEYDWSAHDRMVRWASARGVRLLPVIVGSPKYVANRSTRAPFMGDRQEVEAYKCFVRALVGRYGRGGSFTSQPGVKAITQWQVWNEPNLIKFSTEQRDVNPREYAKLVRLTAGQIRAEDRRATIALAGLPVVDNGFGPSAFLRKFYTVRKIERKFDVVALHPYARNHRGVEGAVLRVRRMLKDVGDGRRYIWITETGWATHGSQFRFLVKGAQGQARELTRTYRMLKRNRKRWNIGTVAWFRWRDKSVPSDNRGAFEYTGLYYKGGSPKPSCKRFVRFTGGRCARIR